nr:glycosyl hydrolase family 17 protein [Hyphomonas sp. Mor2]
MSNPYNRKHSLSGIHTGQLSETDLSALIEKLLNDQIHGLGFSPVMDGQTNKSDISADQIRSRLSVLAPHIKWIRTFSCTRGNELTPGIAKEMGLQSMVGAWIDYEFDRNELELQNAIDIANRGEAGLLAVGNEVLLRGEISEDQLIAYIRRAKAETDVPVGYVDAYFIFENYPRLAEECDVLLVNCYPFWEGYPIEHANVYMREMYRRAQRVANGKPVVIAETGWPNLGSNEMGAEPSRLNAMKYFVDAVQWAQSENIDLFYFAGFDETWKIENEGDVGAYWGLWDKNGKPKYY